MNKNKLLEIEDLRQLSLTDPCNSLYYIGREWLSIIAAVLVCEWFWHPLFYVLVIMWIGARMHALGILGHDGMHYLLFKNKTINDFVTHWFLLFPIGFSLKTFRKVHFEHHKHLNTTKDPEYMNLRQYEEYDFPKTMRGILFTLVKDVTGFNSLVYTLKKWRHRWEGNEKSLQMFAFLQPKKIAVLLVFGLFLYFAGLLDELVLYWFVPMATWFVFCIRLRVIGEHEALTKTALGETRNVIPTFFERWFIVPNYHSLHLVHHLYPSIPTYHLLEGHQKLMENETYKQEAVNTYGYWNMLKECANFKAV
ncbi:MAG: fatty acid desaturase family protein [Chitinophagales bacterium]